MYEELVKWLRLCAKGFRCRECDYENVRLCREKMNNEAADAIEELSAKYQKALSDLVKQAEPKWIPVTERLPKDGEFVLVCNDDKHMMIAKYETETYEWYYKYTNYDFDIWDNEEQGPVCYWMPLPEPPKEET